MDIKEFIEKTGFKILAGEQVENKEVKKQIYCCDLLSYCMTKAPTDGVWVTVMGNINVVAVAALTDTAVVIIADGTTPDEQAIEKANSQEVVMLKSDLPVYETAVLADRILS